MLQTVHWLTRWSEFAQLWQIFANLLSPLSKLFNSSLSKQIWFLNKLKLGSTVVLGIDASYNNIKAFT